MERNQQQERKGLLKKRYSSAGDGKHYPSNLKSVVKNEKTNTTIQIPVVDDRLPIISADPESRPFFFGNPFVEKLTGIVYFYRRCKSEPPFVPTGEQCSMLCMIDVPAFFTCRELIHFVSPMARQISQMKILRDDSINKYMVLFNFKASESAHTFYQQFNNITFNSIEPDKCKLEFVKQIETNATELKSSDNNDVGLPSEQVTDVPTCSVCLERMDDSVLIILCNHSFHAECLQKWTDTTCPVCRYTQTPELVPDQKCFDCDTCSDLWMCLICGNVGCGRYSKAHAFQHYEKTSHIFTLQVGGKLVWDYAGDNYVHRVIQDSADGKMVEYDDTVDIDQKGNEKLSAIQLEYTCLLTGQLETQRLYFEEKLREAHEQFNESNRSTQQNINGLEAELKVVRKECTEFCCELEKASTSRVQLEKKNQQLRQRNQKLQSELDEERHLCELLRADKETLTHQKEALELLRRKEITELESQVHDLMLHFEAQSKINEHLESGELNKEDIEGGGIEVKQQNIGTSEKNTKKRNKRKS